MTKQPFKHRHDSAGECDTCGWDLDRYGDCTNTTCPVLDAGQDSHLVSDSWAGEEWPDDDESGI
jgi:hypothetical protein